MDKRQGDGRDNPKYLDCSSFVAWAFHKCGYSGVPYISTTATFIGSEHFKTIDAGNLKPGDIGLISSTAPTGGANHVGIYCGKLKNVIKVWLHCTSSSGTSLTGNDSGPMFGAYTGFGYFRRFSKNKDLWESHANGELDGQILFLDFDRNKNKDIIYINEGGEFIKYHFNKTHTGNILPYVKVQWM